MRLLEVMGVIIVLCVIAALALSRRPPNTPDPDFGGPEPGDQDSGEV
jgi:hypothetical protein